MKLRKYIKDKRYLILFFLIIMLFISTVVYVDDTVKIRFDNILYINLVSWILFDTYLILEFLYLKNYYKTLDELVENQIEEIHTSLPQGKTQEQNKYNDIIKKVYKYQNEKIEKLYIDKIENMDFITSWVHEIKTPIAVTRLTIESSSGKPMEEFIGSIEEELRKIDNYVEQALYYSKIDDFSKDYFINEIELEKVMKEIIKKNAKTFIGKRISLDMHDIDYSILTDKKWLLFIIDQVISNSLKYTETGGKIEISGEKDEKEKRLTIKDNGTGIKPEDINRVFNKGFTGYNGRIYNKSTGMGLYLAKKMCNKLGHDISIESEYEKYTQVTIHFPKLINYFNVTKV